MKTVFTTLFASALVASFGPSLPASAQELSMADLAVDTVATTDGRGLNCDVTVTNDPVNSGFGDDDSYETIAVVLLPVNSAILSTSVVYEKRNNVTLNCDGLNRCVARPGSSSYVQCYLGQLSRQNNNSRTCAAVATIHIATTPPNPPGFSQTSTCGAFVYSRINDSQMPNNYDSSTATAP